MERGWEEQASECAVSVCVGILLFMLFCGKKTQTPFTLFTKQVKNHAKQYEDILCKEQIDVI